MDYKLSLGNLSELKTILRLLIFVVSDGSESLFVINH